MTSRTSGEEIRSKIAVDRPLPALDPIDVVTRQPVALVGGSAALGPYVAGKMRHVVVAQRAAVQRYLLERLLKLLAAWHRGNRPERQRSGRRDGL